MSFYHAACCCSVAAVTAAVQNLLAGMRDRGGTAAVLEVDTEAQATGSLEWVEPTIAVYTNLGDDPTSMFSSKQVGLCLVSWVSM